MLTFELPLIILPGTNSAIYPTSGFRTYELPHLGNFAPFWHGSQFDVKTGMVQSGPAEKGIRTYEVFVDKEKVMLRWVK